MAFYVLMCRVETTHSVSVRFLADFTTLSCTISTASQCLTLLVGCQEGHVSVNVWFQWLLKVNV